MKKLIILSIILAAASPLFAQTLSPENTSDMYYLSVPVEKIYPSSRGYLIQYRKGANGIGTVALPNEWFTNSAGKGELITLPRGTSWPTLTVFYREGEFSHVRLYVHKSKAHSTWGNVPQSADLSKYFENTDTIKIEY